MKIGKFEIDGMVLFYIVLVIAMVVIASFAK